MDKIQIFSFIVETPNFRFQLQISDKIIEEGRTDELERELEALKLLFDLEKAAAEAEMDAEENEHVHKLTKTINEDHTSALKEKQREMMKDIRDGCPASEQVALQRLMDQHRKDMEGVEQELNLERDRQLGDLQVCNTCCGTLNPSPNKPVLYMSN